MKSSIHANTKIIVSHSGKQYVHRLVQGLLESGYAVVFFSPLWWQKIPAWIKWLPSSLRKKASGEINKKYFPFKGNIKIVQKPSLIFFKKINGKLSSATSINKEQLNLEKRHDIFVAKQVADQHATVILGYEISSVHTFQVAKKTKKITILDLAQVHYKTISSIAKQFDEVAYLVNDEDLQEIIARKQAEYDLADYILVLSSFARQTMIDNNIDEKKLLKVSLGFDVNTFIPKENYSGNGPLKLMICGTDMMRKGLGILVKVLAHMKEDGFEFTLTVVCPAAEIAVMEKKHEGISFVRHYNFMSHKELVKQYQEADIFVFPSYLDSWAMTVLEAMACGTPVIVTENTGSKDAVQQGGGYVIPAGDPTSLRKAIETFYYNRSLLPELGKRAREVALQYTWENYYSEIEAVMGKINKSGLN